MGGGTVKFLAGEMTSDANGRIIFPSDRSVINATLGTSSSTTVANTKYLLIRGSDATDMAIKMIGSNGVESLSANTTYWIRYSYILKED